jgi:hypothetical protein
MELYVEDPDAARAALEIFFNGKLEPNTKILQVMLESNQERLGMAKHAEAYHQIRSELINTLLSLYAKDDKHKRLIEVAELAILNNDLETAEDNLEILLERNDTPTNILTEATVHLKTLQRKD